MKNLVKLGYVAAALSLAASFTGCGLIPTPPPNTGTSSPSQESQESQEGQESKAESTGWPEQNRQAFLKSCEATSGGLTEYCECALRESEEKFTFEEMTELERRALKDPSAVEEMQSVIQSCAELAS